MFNKSIICLDQDGNIRIENVGECLGCDTTLFDLSFNEKISNLSQDNCTDIILDINCNNENQIINKQKEINQINFIVGLLSSKNVKNYNFKLNSRFNKLFLTNHPLFSYSTVSLLI